MTQDEIIRSPLGRDQIIDLAREAGFINLALEPKITRFAALVAAHEREACAKVCEAEQFPEIEDESCEPYNMGCRHSAAAIRARSMDLLTQHSQAIGEYNDYP